MKLRPLIIDDALKAEIARVIAYAETHRIDTSELTALERDGQQLGIDHAPAVGDDPLRRVETHFGYRMVFSIEEQPPPACWCRHFSISVPEPGKFPHPAIVAELLQLFGFRFGLGDPWKLGDFGPSANHVSLEGGHAINVIEPLAAEPV